jgi:hypothetical protein
VGPAADIILAAGALTVLNETVLAPAAGSKAEFSWKVIPATGILALMIDGLSALNAELAIGISVSVFITVLLAVNGKSGSPVGNLTKAMGYQKK